MDYSQDNKVPTNSDNNLYILGYKKDENVYNPANDNEDLSEITV